MSRPIILIVDDDQDLRESLADALHDEGYRVARAANGLLAIEYLRTHAAPALILLDWMMPECDGACFRRLQKRDPALAGIPVVLLTADVRIEAKIREIDVDEYFVKPVALERLLESIRRHVMDAAPAAGSPG